MRLDFQVHTRLQAPYASNHGNPKHNLPQLHVYVHTHNITQWTLLPCHHHQQQYTIMPGGLDDHYHNCLIIAHIIPLNLELSAILWSHHPAVTKETKVGHTILNVGAECNEKDTTVFEHIPTEVKGHTCTLVMMDKRSVNSKTALSILNNCYVVLLWQTLSVVAAT